MDRKMTVKEFLLEKEYKSSKDLFKGLLFYMILPFSLMGFLLGFITDGFSVNDLYNVGIIVSIFFLFWGIAYLRVKEEGRLFKKAINKDDFTYKFEICARILKNELNLIVETEEGNLYKLQEDKIDVDDMLLCATINIEDYQIKRVYPVKGYQFIK